MEKDAIEVESSNEDYPNARLDDACHQ